MLWVCFTAGGAGRLVKIEDKVNEAKFRKILEGNLLQSAKELQLGRRFVFQQDNGPKHIAKGTHNWFKNSSVLEGLGQNPNFKPLENL